MIGSSWQNQGNIVEMTELERNYIKVYYSSGGFFYTRARTATEFVLDPIFLQFILISVFMFSSLMMVLDVPLVAQMIFFGAGVVASFFWLTVSIFLYLFLSRKKETVTIVTPALLLPMQVINTATVEFVLRYFGTSYVDGFNGLFEIAVRTFIVIVCLDIIHGKFVAPLHGMTVSAKDIEGAAQRDTSAQASVPPENPALPQRDMPGQPSAANSAVPIAPVHSNDTPLAPEKKAANKKYPLQTISIGSETFDLNEVEYVSSEDHYLMVHYNETSKMVRGRLRDVVAKIDIAWGVQLNRSTWVAFSAIESVNETSNGRLEVVLKDGTCLRVAESRRVFFMHTYLQRQA